MIKVKRKTRYQNIKDVLHFEDLTEILDYCFLHCNDEVNNKVNDLLESDDYKNNNEYKLCVEWILDEMFLDNYEIKIIFNE